MIFGALPLGEAEGAVLAHSVALPDGRLKKGTRLGAADLARLAEAGHASVIAARLDADDVAEDAAAERLGRALAPDPAALGLTRSAAFTGRLNLHAARSGLLRLDRDRVQAINAVHEAVTLATLEDAVRVEAGAMVATVKIIPYAAPEAALAAAERLVVGTPVLAVDPPAIASAGLVLTVTPGMKPTLLDKGAEAVRARLDALGVTLAEECRVAHEEAPLAGALGAIDGEIVLILTASATSDRLDVGPAALAAAGGRLDRFGMPVDPGNLLFLGVLGGRTVIGLPGCARSPALNGADWVLDRVVHGRVPDAGTIGAMGVGGLLKEIPARPSPRTAAPAGRRPRVAGVLLAAGSARRMQGRDKLLEAIDGEPILTRLARTLMAAGVDQALAVVRPDDGARRAALAGTGLGIVENPRAAEGMGGSLARGVAALPMGVDAALIALADMPDLEADDLARLIAAFDPGEGREIVRAAAQDGTPGHPVLFGRRFFEPLASLGGDEGARRVLAEHRDYVVEVRLPGRRAITDLDTPEAWASWRAARAG